MSTEINFNSSHGTVLLIAMGEIGQQELDNKKPEEKDKIFDRVRASVRQKFHGTEVLEEGVVKTSLEELIAMYEGLRKNGQPTHEQYTLLSALSQELRTYASAIPMQIYMLELSTDKTDVRFNHVLVAARELARIVPKLSSFFKITEVDYQQATEIIVGLEQKLREVEGVREEGLEEDQRKYRQEEIKRLKVEIDQMEHLTYFVDGLPEEMEALKLSLLQAQKMLVDSQSETSILHPHFLENKDETLRIIQEIDLVNPIMPPPKQMISVPEGK